MISSYSTKIKHFLIQICLIAELQLYVLLARDEIVTGFNDDWDEEFSMVFTTFKFQLLLKQFVVTGQHATWSYNWD